LGMVIVLFLTNLYSDLSRSTTELTKTSSQIENARFALGFLNKDIAHAGYWAGYMPSYDDMSYAGPPFDAPTLVPDPCLAYNLWPDATTPGHIDAMIGISIQVHDSAPGTCAALLPNKAANTDVLVIRRAEACIKGDTNCSANVDKTLNFQYSNCEAELDAGDLYALDPNDLPLHEKDCADPVDPNDPVAGKRRFQQYIYYVRDYFEVEGDGIPVLMRSEFGLTGTVPTQQTPVAIVVGIDRFRAELGVDDKSDSGANVDLSAAIVWADKENRIAPTNRGDGIQDGPYIHCGAACTGSQLTNTVSARIYLLARANRPSPGYTDTKEYALGDLTVIPFDDNYKRHVFNTTVRLTTVSGRRETP
jgi:type IV pilus assembly protein PilW